MSTNLLVGSEEFAGVYAEVINQTRGCTSKVVGSDKCSEHLMDNVLQRMVCSSFWIHFEYAHAMLHVR
eukprot:1139159-Pelagomonas_calceolata.AAC.4